MVLVDLDAEKASAEADTLAKRLNRAIVPWACDITSDDDIQRLFRMVSSRFGRFDQLINNAGLNQKSNFAQLGAAEFQSVLAVNLWGATALCQAALPLWRSTGGGQVVNISSRTWLTGGPVAYVASKAGVVGLTHALAVELAPDNVTVNAVAPSTVATPFIAQNRDEEQLASHLSHHARLTLLDRLATATDVADAVAFLASPRASFITGEILHVAGGAQLAPPSQSRLVKKSHEDGCNNNP